MSFSRDWTRYGIWRVAGCLAICRKASSSRSVSFGGRIWSILRICAYGSHDQAGFVRPDDDSEGVGGSRSKIPVCSTTRVKSAIVFSLITDRSGGHMEIRHEANILLGSCSVHSTDKPWRRTDAKTGNHRPRWMGHHGSLGNCTSRARAASTEAPTAHPNGRYQEALDCRLPAWDR